MSRVAPRAVPLSRFVVTTLVTLLSVQSVYAQRFRPIEEGPVHEAYIPALLNAVALDAIGREPPPPITERIPPKCAEDVVWIKGYWDYDEDVDDFRWVAGTWRKEPPGCHWVEGYWERFDEGWVWIRGFWSSVPHERL